MTHLDKFYMIRREVRNILCKMTHYRFHNPRDHEYKWSLHKYDIRETSNSTSYKNGDYKVDTI